MTHDAAKHHDNEVASVIHRNKQVNEAEHQLHRLVKQLLTDCVVNGTVRTDVPPDELATYCLTALSAAARLQTKAAIRRLVGVTLNGLRCVESP